MSTISIRIHFDYEDITIDRADLIQWLDDDGEDLDGDETDEELLAMLSEGNISEFAENYANCPDAIRAEVATE